ncbi:transcription factor, MADS-box [Artemisia annua]|uniref:Transcription factor, MADS-box n=1 Tax=Artemisia annua TaxID=35608 RepID=A0A2U1P9E9_ARTAN|nr:transcription factor, MADS-box [Artemisia annua]
MGRVKIPIEPINDIKKRKITFIRRKEGMIKKARELSTLCDVNVSMIICSNHQKSPEIFPQDTVKLNDMIDAYKTKRVSDPGKIKSYGVCDFFTDRKNKIEDELVKAKKRNLQTKYPTPNMDNSSEEQLRDFAHDLGIKIELLKLKKMSNFQNLGHQGLLKMPLLNPNPRTMMTHIDYNNKNNIIKPEFSKFDGHVESSGSSNSNVDNGYYSRMPMDQNVFGNDQRMMQAVNPSLVMKSEDVNNCYDDANFDLKPEMMQRLEQPQLMNMQQLLVSCFDY